MLIAVVLIAVLVLVVVVVEVPSNSPVLTCYFLIAAIFLFAIGPILRDAVHHRLDIFNIKYGFLAYYWLQLGAYPIFLFARGNSPFYGLETETDAGLYEEVLGLTLAGLVFFLIGNNNRMAASLARLAPRFRSTRWSLRSVKTLAFCTTAAGFGSSAIFFRQHGGVNQFLVDRELWRSQGVAGSGPLTLPASFLLPTGAIMVFLALSERRRLRGKWPYASILLLVVSLLPSALLGFRLPMLSAILSFVGIWHYRYNRFKLRTIVGTALFLTIALTWYGLNRESKGVLDASIDWADVGRQVVLRVQGTDVVAVVVQSIDSGMSYRYFWQSGLEALTIPIPRLLWPGKMNPQGIEFATSIFGGYFERAGRRTEGYSGVSPTMVGYLYWQCGWAGVCIGMFIFGIAVRACYECFKHNMANSSCLFLYLVAFSQGVFMAESPQDALNGAVIKVAVSLLMIALVAERRRA